MQVNGIKLQNEIARRHLNYNQFAAKAGVSTYGLYRAIKGSRPHMATLGKIATALDIDDPTELLLKPQEAHNG
ncbi:MAG: helix-turn-helix domain-containing protein [Selenomonadaceae bacterium]|nr:helix-turn-helix domain-containing protein [Selenomonadaceae bacterium]